MVHILGGGGGGVLPYVHVLYAVHFLYIYVAFFGAYFRVTVLGFSVYMEKLPSQMRVLN